MADSSENYWWDLGSKGLRVQIPIFTFGSPWAESKPADTKTRSGSNWNKFHKQQILRIVFNLSHNPGLLRLWCLQKFFLLFRRLCTPHPKPIKQKISNWSIVIHIYIWVLNGTIFYLFWLWLANILVLNKNNKNHQQYCHLQKNFNLQLL